MTDKQKQLLAVLEDSAIVLRKTQTNLKKCPKERLTKGYIESRIKMIDEYWTTFNNGHQELVKATPSEQRGVLPYFLNEEFFIYEDLYNVLRGDLMDRLSSLVQDTLMETSITNASYAIAGTQNNFVRLPRIELPTFSGSYEEWPAFKDLFMSLVHNNKMLSDVQRLHYLKTSVTAEASSLLRHIQITSDNYSQAWLILKTRYGNKRLILNNNLKKLVNQRKMTTQSAVQLKVLLDTTSECLHNIQNLNVSVDSWDPLVLFLLVQKLDPETHKDWEEHAYKSDSEPLPKWSDFKEFLEAKFRTLELLSNNTREVKSNKERSTCHVATPTFENRSCVMCKESHTLCHCKEFTKMEPTERSEYVKNNNLCYNCLVPGHSASKCRVPVSCRICHRRHHSLLHQLKQTEPVAPTSPSQPLASSLHVVEDIEEVQANTVIALHLTTRQKSALLATAVVEARSNQGHIIPLRALIDQGSEESFISEKAAQLLKLDRQHVRGSITGLGPMRTEINHVCELQIKSQWDKTFVLPVKAYVMSKQLTKKLPKKHIVQQPWPHLQGLQLADPNYNNSGPIDLLLGVRVYARILQAELVKGPPGTPCAQRTDLGWIIFGESDNTSQEDSYIVMHHQVDIEDTLKSLWEIETDTKRKYTKEEQLCEEIYEKTVTRNQEGRYIMKLPFKTENPRVLDGNTKEIAKRRFMQLERKFKRSPNLKTEYIKGINDYLDEGHLEEVPTTSMFAWTDSSIVIAWLCGEPNRWKPFVANRVVEIVENLNNKHWYHVQSKDNPADIASRGMKLSTLKNYDLWWHGPSWLSEKEINISKQEDFTTDKEIKVQKIQTYLNIEDLEKQEKALTTQFVDFDKLTELLKSIVYCRRFLNYKKNPDGIDKDITTMELQNAMNICIKMAQQEEYQEEIVRLTSNKQVKRKSCLRSLAPYVDENKFLRVGGRLRYANIDENRKHPIILGNKNSLVPLIIADAHTRTLHGTMAEMLCYLRSKYWILRSKSLVKRHIQKCLTCAKQNATSKPQIMGDLPETRVTPSRPFLHSGVDFAGPYQILTSKGRGGKTVKAYIAIFICMAVKAIHIELVGDLTSEAFIAAFKRFVARRGKCTHMWSDQGRNFVGANKELVEAWNEAKLKFTGPIAETLAIEGTQWHFILAYSPNFGSLWEAGVKSIKHYLKRVLTTNLTFEEMTTVLYEIEACLNSRPLCPLDNSDPENAEILTPGHFLIGEAPIVVPAADYQECKIHTLSRWQLTQKLLADFWRRWQDEYLSRLQQRPKWLKKEKEFKIGDIVLIKTDNLSPGKWSLGRIMDKHPAEDGFTRVYSVKSGSTIVKRSVTKLCALPVDTETL